MAHGVVRVSVVAELALTPERRDQLRAYLGSDQLLRNEYPQVARYFDAVPGLSGTGNDQADANFDVRFLHFMTGGQRVSENPYWEIVAPDVFEHEGRRVVNGGNASGSGRLAYAQTILQEAYAYAIPSPETINWLARFCGGRSLVELGAGRGYWASQLSHAGIQVAAYELEPPDQTDNISFPRVRGLDHVWHPVSGLDGYKLAEEGDKVLFLCWPPGWGNTMASEALTAFERSGGNRLVFIGEPRGGKTGDGAFFDGLADRWSLESVDPLFVSWWNLADVAQGWVRR